LNRSARLEAIFKLYDAGALCTCADYEYVLVESPEYGQVQRKEIAHRQNCEARFKMVDLLNHKEDKDG